MNQIQIFKYEIEDGIADSVKSTASVAYCSPATIHKGNWTTPTEVLFPKNENVLEQVVAQNKDQFDLFYLESVLVSTGWNKNDDVFLAEATWEARNTPEDKQFNYMHDENDIIGHITGSYVLTKDGRRLSNDNDESRPEEFDIITQAVLYNSWTNPENRERMQQIIAEIQEGKWFVSMECLFAGFDYAMMDEKGAARLIERNESSAFLTKYLRSYGGNGEYKNYKIGRALRQISFSGKGLVSKPANPRSIILLPKSVASFNVSEKISDFSIGENVMTETTALEKQIEDLKAELASAKEENKTIKAQIEEVKDKEITSKIQAFETVITEKDQSIAEMEETIKSTQAKIAELEDALTKSNEQLQAAMKDMQEMKKKEKMQKRMAALLEVGFEQEEAEESLASFQDLTDESFESVVAAWKKKMAKMSMKKDKEMKEEKPMAQEEVTPETFAKVETTEATLVEAEVPNEVETARASVASWLENNVLTKKRK